jgi:glycosyltransferase involved in cell wall biosynthesis
VAKVSVIIPSINCRFASRTVADIFAKATGEIEVIIILDNYWPDPPIKEHPNLTVVYKGIRTGMRNSINIGASIATGKYLMKCDDHCIFGEGFDEILQADMNYKDLVIPSKYSLDPDKWERRRRAVEYEYMAFPYPLDWPSGIGLYSKKWIGEDGIGLNSGVEQFYWKENARKDILIDEIMIFQGSFWFMERDAFFYIGGLDEKHCNEIHQEPQELTLKTWLSGGRMIVNKKTWYAHMYKNDEMGRGYKLNLTEMRQTERFGTWYWMNNKWPGQKRSIKWLIEKFWPIPGWPENWEELKTIFENKYPEKCSNFRIFNPNGRDALPLNEGSTNGKVIGSDTIS